MLATKGKINKKNNQDSLLFDDGFAVGLAYLFKLLNQVHDFNSLQWFTTVRKRFDAERQKITGLMSEVNANSPAGSSKKKSAQSAQNQDKEKLQQTLALTERRVNAYQMEYNLLYYNLSSAKIFFH